MEVQDLNNMINMPNFTKGNNSSQDLVSSTGVDFASLLGGKDVFSSKENASRSVIESGLKSKDKTVENTNRESNYDKPVAKTTKENDGYKSASAKKTTAGDKSSAKNASEKQTIETPSSVWSQPYVNTVDAQEVQLVDENGNIIPLYNEEGELNLEALAYVEGFISFINPATGEEQVLSIDDFTKKIASGEIPLITSDDVVDVVNKEGISLVGMKPTKDKEVFVADASTDVEPEVVAKDQPVDVKDEGKKFDEVVVDDKTVSVKVDVKEEKISPSATKPLVVETKPATETVEKVDTKQVAHQVAESSPTTETSEVQTQVSANKDVNAQVDVNVVDVPDVSPANTHVKTDVNATTLSQTVSAGVDASGLARTDSLSENNRLSNQDVYKGLGKEAVEQVKVNIMKSAVKGVDKIEIQLKPQELGNVEVKLQIGKDGKLTAQIIASRADTADILQKDMQSLEKAFNDAGFKTGDGALSFAYRDEANQNNEKNSGLRAFMGNVLEENTDLPTNYSEASWDGKSALNIRV